MAIQTRMPVLIIVRSEVHYFKGWYSGHIVQRHASIKTDDTIQSEKYALVNIKYFPEQSSGKRLSGKTQFINCAHNHIGINGYFLELSAYTPNNTGDKGRQQ